MRKEFTRVHLDELHAQADALEDGLVSFGSKVSQIAPLVAGPGVAALGKLLHAQDAYRAYVHKKVSSYKEKVTVVFERVSSVDNRYAGKAKQHELDTLKPVRTYLGELKTTIRPGSGQFSKDAIEKRFSGLRDDLPYYNPAFAGGGNDELNTDGQYGGDQGAPAANWRKYRDVVRRYYPNMSDKDIEKLLKKINGSGCGYVALINTLFSRYKGREAEFERDFGFSMYEEDGTYNYERLLIDLCLTEKGTNVTGTNQESRKKMWKHYLKGKGVEVDMSDLSPDDITPDNFNDVRGHGEIIIATRPLRMRDESGRLVDDRDGGHAMTVTGMTDDGLYIVSSWGGKYYIDPHDYPAAKDQDESHRLQLALVNYP